MTLPDYLAPLGHFDHPALELGAAATYGIGLAAEAADIATTYATDVANLAAPAARAAWAWASTDGLDHLANGAQTAADGLLDGIGTGMDTLFVTAAYGGAIDATTRRHAGHPHAIDRPRAARR